MVPLAVVDVGIRARGEVLVLAVQAVPGSVGRNVRAEAKLARLPVQRPADRPGALAVLHAEPPQHGIVRERRVLGEPFDREVAALQKRIVGEDHAAAVETERLGRDDLGALVAVEVDPQRPVDEGRGAAAAERAADAIRRIRRVLPRREVVVEVREERIARNERAGGQELAGVQGAFRDAEVVEPPGERLGGRILSAEVELGRGARRERVGLRGDLAVVEIGGERALVRVVHERVMVPLSVVHAHGRVEVLVASLRGEESGQEEAVRLVDHDLRERAVQEGVGVDAVAGGHLPVGLEEPLHREAALGQMRILVGDAQHMGRFPVHRTIPGHFRVLAFLTSNIDSRRKMAVFTFCRNEAYRKQDYGYLFEYERFTCKTVIQWIVA